jgi:hypothetical protein
VRTSALIAFLLTIATTIGVQHVSQAGQVCVAYRVTAPVLGERSGTPCLSDPFTHPFSLYDCEGVPPLRVQACATVRADTP